MSRKLSIYVVEKPVISMFSGKPDFYHSFLALVDETKQPASSGDFEPLQELHFMDTENDGVLTARVYTRERHINTGMFLIGCTGGDEIPIRKIWNCALRVGEAVRGLGPEFNKAAHSEGVFNCRSGVEAGLAAMGLTYTWGAQEQPVSEREREVLEQGLNKGLLGFVSWRMPPPADETSDAGVTAEAERLTRVLSL